MRFWTWHTPRSKLAVHIRFSVFSSVPRVRPRGEKCTNQVEFFRSAGKKSASTEVEPCAVRVRCSVVRVDTHTIETKLLEISIDHSAERTSRNLLILEIEMTLYGKVHDVRTSTCTSRGPPSHLNLASRTHSHVYSTPD